MSENKTDILIYLSKDFADAVLNGDQSDARVQELQTVIENHGATIKQLHAGLDESAAQFEDFDEIRKMVSEMTELVKKKISEDVYLIEVPEDNSDALAADIKTSSFGKSVSFNIC